MRLARAIVAASAVLLLTGCGADAPAPVPSLTGGAKANADLTVGACPPGTGSLTATGTITNTGDDGADYVVRIDWLDTEGAVVGSAWDEVDAVAAGAGAEWSVEVDLGEESASSCTTTLTRGVK